MDGGLLVVLSAPSGGGKTTLARRLAAETKDTVISVSYTTRPLRGHEQDGLDYHFVDAGAFQAMIDRGELLEWAEVHGHRYGSHRRYADLAKDGKVVLFVIDVQGGASIRRKVRGAVLVFVFPPSVHELERRLRERKTDSDETIRNRLEVARQEMETGREEYDYHLVNDDLDRAYEDLKAIIRAERLRRGRVPLRP
jgi:guanylate kinase